MPPFINRPLINDVELSLWLLIIVCICVNVAKDKSSNMMKLSLIISKIFLIVVLILLFIANDITTIAVVNKNAGKGNSQDRHPPIQITNNRVSAL